MTTRATGRVGAPPTGPRAEGSDAEAQAAWETLEALETGVLLVAGDLCIRFANARMRGWIGAGATTGEPLAPLVEDAAALAQVEATRTDGQPREVMLVSRPAAADLGTRRLPCTVRQAGESLILEARLGDAEPASLQVVARRLAEVADMAEVLRTLCDIAMRQCRATGAAVLRLSANVGEVVAASGDMATARGRHFESDGSMLREALLQHTVVGERDFSSSGRPLTRVVPELQLGPTLAAPLRAHGEDLGVLAITRPVGGRAFAARDVDRLRMLADHAALAVHKSLLLQRAQAADRAKGRFLATMSHELRTPLTALAGYGELLADQVIGPLSESQLDILERMRSVTTHLSAMIEEILAFTSLEEGRETVRPTEFLAEDLVRSAAAVVEPLAEQKGLSLTLALPRGSVRMTSDIDKARQILVNLLGNAVKFTDHGGVTMTLARGSRSVRIEVADTGIGIPMDELSRLFKPFAQVDTGLTRRHGGTGLGLYISRRLATMLGGHIEVDSTPGKGSRFTVVLPGEWAST